MRGAAGCLGEEGRRRRGTHLLKEMLISLSKWVPGGIAGLGEAWRRPADHLLKKIIISLSKSEALRPDVDFP